MIKDIKKGMRGLALTALTAAVITIGHDISALEYLSESRQTYDLQTIKTDIILENSFDDLQKQRENPVVFGTALEDYLAAKVSLYSQRKIELMLVYESERQEALDRSWVLKYLI